MKWKTKDGKKIDIKEMSDDHLLNAIKMLKLQLTELELEFLHRHKYIHIEDDEEMQMLAAGFDRYGKIDNE